MILGWHKRSKFASSAEKKNAESREETHQPPYVVNFTCEDDKHVVRKIKQPRAENCLVLLLQVLYCNLELHDCQGPLRIKINAQILIRSKQRISSSRSFPSCRRKAVGTRMMDMVVFCFWEHQYAYQNSKIDMQ